MGFHSPQACTSKLISVTLKWPTERCFYLVQITKICLKTWFLGCYALASLDKGVAAPCYRPNLGQCTVWPKWSVTMLFKRFIMTRTVCTKSPNFIPEDLDFLLQCKHHSCTISATSLSFGNNNQQRQIWLCSSFSLLASNSCVTRLFPCFSSLQDPIHHSVSSVSFPLIFLCWSAPILNWFTVFSSSFIRAVN